MQVTCSADTLDLIFNDRHFYGLMKKATPYKVKNKQKRLNIGLKMTVTDEGHVFGYQQRKKCPQTGVFR